MYEKGQDNALMTWDSPYSQIPIRKCPTPQSSQTALSGPHRNSLFAANKEHAANRHKENATGNGGPVTFDSPGLRPSLIQ